MQMPFLRYREHCYELGYVYCNYLYHKTMSEFLKTFDKLNDAQLRSSVKLLGKLLGNIIKSHAGDKVYMAVENLEKDS